MPVEGLTYKLEARSTDPERRIALVLKYEGMGVVAGLPGVADTPLAEKAVVMIPIRTSLLPAFPFKSKPTVPAGGAHCRIRYARQRGDTAHGPLLRRESPDKASGSSAGP